jgi:hypothetical protein
MERPWSRDIAIPMRPLGGAEAAQVSDSALFQEVIQVLFPV